MDAEVKDATGETRQQTGGKTETATTTVKQKVRKDPIPTVTNLNWTFCLC